jgi:hypothetical protein
VAYTRNTSHMLGARTKRGGGAVQWVLSASVTWETFWIGYQRISLRATHGLWRSGLGKGMAITLTETRKERGSRDIHGLYSVNINSKSIPNLSSSL